MKVRLGDYIQEYSVKNKYNEDFPVYSVTNKKGFCKDFFSKDVASKDKTTYKIVPRGCFAYNPSRINVGSVDWQRKEEKVIVSPLYNVFAVSPKLNQQYLYYYLKSKISLYYIKNVATGSVRDNLKLSMLYEFPINLPDIMEQQCIVKILDTVCSLILIYQQKLDQYDNLIKARFVEMFGDEKYPSRTVNELCTNIVDCPHSTPKWVQKGKLCLRTTNFKPGYLNLSEKNYVSEETFCERISRLAPKPGDVLFSREGAILGIACIIPDGLEVCMGQRMMLLRPSEDLLNKYLMYYLNSPKARTLIIENVGGTASPHINVGDIKNFTIPIIPFAQQQSVVAEIESRLSVCDNIEKTVGTALQQAEALRQSILKIAFEGGL